MIYVENGGAGARGVFLEDLEHDSNRSWKNLEVNIFANSKIFIKDFYLIKASLLLLEPYHCVLILKSRLQMQMGMLF